MSAVVKPFIAPNTVDMLAHAEHLFGGYLDGFHNGKIELSWTETIPDASGRYRLTHARFFGTDELTDLVEEAERLNSQPMCNVYIGAALRNPDTPPFGRGRDDDFLAASAFWCDLDSSDSVRHALANYASAKPTLLVMTGETPHRRVQCWWRLAGAIDDPSRLRNAISGIAYKMGGDTTVTNPSRVMRLAGTIAWPHKDGRVAEVTRVIPLKEPGLQQYYAEHLEQVFPPVVSLAAAKERRHVADGGDGSIMRLSGPMGLQNGKVGDGREKYMRNVILAAMIEFVGTNGAVPTADELFELGWPTYQKNTDFSRPGRGESEFKEKCQYTIRRFDAGQIPGLRTIDEAVTAWHRKCAARTAFAPSVSLDWSTAASQHEPGIATVDFATLINEDVVEEPDYIEPGFAGPGNFILVAGPPKAQKSFLLQEMLVAAACGDTFLAGTFNVPRPLRIFYLQAEMNRKLLRKRAREMKFLSAEQKALLSQNFIVSERFHMILNDGGVAVAAKAIMEAFPDQPPDIIAIDPLANVFDQENENDNTQIMRFLTSRVEAVRQKVNPLACVVLVHHATKKGVEDLARDPFVAIRGGGALRGYYDSAIVIYRASEEGAARKVHFELRGAESPEPITVELVNGRFVKSDPLGGIDKMVARRILTAVDEAWRSGSPWSLSGKSKNEGRHLGENAFRLFGVPANAAEALAKSWMANGVVAHRERVFRKHPAGLEVVGSID